MAFAVRAFGPAVVCNSSSLDADHMLKAAQIADKSAGFTAPHPNFGCIIARDSKVVGEGFLYAQGTKCAEIQAVEKAGQLSKGATAYLNLEPGDCHGDESAINALVQAGISRVVMGLRHPLEHFRGKAIRALRNEGIEVDVFEEDMKSKNIEGSKSSLVKKLQIQDWEFSRQEALKACQLVNAPLLYRAAYRIPFSVLKYAMTLDGKIAASTGHSSWVSNKRSRKRVWEMRGRSDAIVVGGNTVCRDDPQLTTREKYGHFPVRIVMSRTLNLPEDAKLWDVSTAQTIVATQRGARKDFQQRLTSKGVEVVEFDMLTVRDVMDYCYDCGYLCVLWECGGALSASAIASGVIHKVTAFVAPKIIGGVTAPSPVGELGMVEMTQALNLQDVLFEQIGSDMLISGYLQPIPDLLPTIPALNATSALDRMIVSAPNEPSMISFHKAWDPYGAFSNFSPHPINIPNSCGDHVIWRSVEHYYQAQKFESVQNSIAQECVKRIISAESPEEAARIGRSLKRQRPDLVRADWESVKVDVMYRALKAKFSSYPHLSSLLLSTVGSVLVESSPHDLFWGGGREGEGLNHLGRLLARIRAEFLGEDQDINERKLSTAESVARRQ